MPTIIIGYKNENIFKILYLDPNRKNKNVFNYLKSTLCKTKINMQLRVRILCLFCPIKWNGDLDPTETSCNRLNASEMKCYRGCFENCGSIISLIEHSILEPIAKPL